MPITGSDHLTYASLVERFLGEPEKTVRNGNIQQYRRARYTEAAIRAYAEAFDAVKTPCPGSNKTFVRCHNAGIHAAAATGGFCSPEKRAYDARQARHAAGSCPG